MSDNTKLSYPIGGKNVQGGFPAANQTLQFNAVTNQWEFVAAAGGQTFARVVKKVSGFLQNDATLNDDPELFVPVTGGLRYGFLCVLFIDSGAAADFRYDFTVSGGVGRILLGTPSSSAPTSTQDITTTVLPLTGGGAQALVIFGTFEPAVNGNFQFRWAQGSSSGSGTNLFEGSYLVVWEELP